LYNKFSADLTRCMWTKEWVTR